MVNLKKKRQFMFPIKAKSKPNRTNAAIALSKTAKYSDKCRQKFREHHGLEILQSRMSQIKI